MSIENGRAKQRTFLTPKEAAAYICVNPRTFLRWLKIKKKGIPHRRLGLTCIRIPRDEFLEWANPKTKD